MKNGVNPQVVCSTYKKVNNRRNVKETVGKTEAHAIKGEKSPWADAIERGLRRILAVNDCFDPSLQRRCSLLACFVLLLCYGGIRLHIIMVILITMKAQLFLRITNTQGGKKKSHGKTKRRLRFRPHIILCCNNIDFSNLDNCITVILVFILLSQVFSWQN